MFLSKNKKSEHAKSVSTVFSPENTKRLLSKESPFAIREAYNAFRARLMFFKSGDECPVFVFSSVNSGEGKTMTTINLAISFAEAGKRTVIIDADMRNPSVHRYFSLKGDPGFSEYLAGIQEEALIRDTDRENLFVISAGQIPPNPAELLISERAGALLASLKEKFDYIFIDTPPVGMVADAMMLAAECTGYIMVVRNGTTRVADLKAVQRNLEEVGGKVAGIVTNDISGITNRKSGNYYYYKKKHYGYYRSYGYYYGKDYNEKKR